MGGAPVSRGPRSPESPLPPPAPQAERSAAARSASRRGEGPRCCMGESVAVTSGGRHRKLRRGGPVRLVCGRPGGATARVRASAAAVRELASAGRGGMAARVVFGRIALFGQMGRGGAARTARRSRVGGRAWRGFRRRRASWRGGLGRRGGGAAFGRIAPSDKRPAASAAPLRAARGRSRVRAARGRSRAGRCACGGAGAWSRRGADRSTLDASATVRRREAHQLGISAEERRLVQRFASTQPVECCACSRPSPAVRSCTRLNLAAPRFGRRDGVR
jgi:hypothetical protein